MARTPWYYTLSPDCFSRYFFLKEIQKKIFGSHPIKVLEVGGKDNPIWALFEDEKLPYDLTVVDVLPADEDTQHYHYIQGDGTKMEFPDSSFESVISTDVLGHVPSRRKRSFITECIRVAKDVVVIAAPFESPLTDYAEHLVNDVYKTYAKKDYQWLKNDFEVSKPTRELIESVLNEAELPYVVFENNALSNWVEILTLTFLALSAGVDQKAVDKINLFFNQHLLELDDYSSPAYRQFYIIFKNPKLKKTVDQLFSFKPNPQRDLEFHQLMAGLIGEELSRIKQEQNSPDEKKDQLQLIEEQENHRVEELENQNEKLEKEIKQLEQDVHELSWKFNRYSNTKFFRTWQVFNQLKKII